MLGAVDILAERVEDAADLIVSLRTKVRSLEQELREARASQTPPPAPQQNHLPDRALVEELERLRAERLALRESIRELIREIDQVAW